MVYIYMCLCCLRSMIFLSPPLFFFFWNSDLSAVLWMMLKLQGPRKKILLALLPRAKRQSWCVCFGIIWANTGWDRLAIFGWREKTSPEFLQEHTICLYPLQGLRVPCICCCIFAFKNILLQILDCLWEILMCRLFLPLFLSYLEKNRKRNHLCTIITVWSVNGILPEFKEPTVIQQNVMNFFFFFFLHHFTKLWASFIDDAVNSL